MKRIGWLSTGLSAICVISAAAGQPVGADGTWVRVYGGASLDAARTILETADGGLLLAGHTTSFGDSSGDLMLIKLDAGGSPVWTRTYGGDGVESGALLEPTTGGEYLLGARTTSFGAVAGDIWIARLTASGEISWARRYGGDGLDSILAIRATSDGGFVATGRTESFGAGTVGDVWVIKCDASGSITWQRRYGTDGGWESSWDIQPALDGGYFVTGETTSFGAVNYDLWVLKLRSNGVVEWERRFGDFDVDRGFRIAATPDGGCLVAGDSFSFEVVGTSFDMWLLKLDATGQVEWQKAYGSTRDDEISSLERTADGGFLLAGYGETSVPPKYDSWIMKLDSDGDLVWQRTFGAADGSDDDLFADARELVGGGYVVAGSTGTLGIGGRDVLVLELDSDGSFSDCPMIRDWVAMVETPGVSGVVTNASVRDTSCVPAATTPTEASASLFVQDICRPAPRVALPQTGQTIAYYPKDDGDVRAGVPWPSPRFRDNGNGTSTDMLTGLTWLKDAACLGQWTWDAAFDTVAAFNAEPSPFACAGYDAGQHVATWRVPNVNEFESLVNTEVADQRTWLAGQGFVGVGDRIWTSSYRSIYFPWTLKIIEGQVADSSREYLYPVWPVRDGQQDIPDPSFPANVWKTGQTVSEHAGDDAAMHWGVVVPSPRFVDRGDGTSTDMLTGLVWLHDVNCFGTLPWPQAMNAIEQFNASPAAFPCVGYTGTYNDWRMPNRKEMLSLLDRGGQHPALPLGHPFVNFPAYPGVHHWTSTTYGGVTRFAWIFMLWAGLMEWQGKDSPSATLYVLPVRGGLMGTATSAGRVPQDAMLPGTPLTVDQAAGGQLTLSWGASCLASDTDYEIYEGAIGSFAGHAPRACTTGGATTLTIAPAAGDRFFLVVPTSGGVEGSYGLTSAGAERPPGASVCRPQSIGACPTM